MAENYVYNEMPVKTTLSSSHATPDEIVDIAKQIWRKVAESKIAIDDNAGNDQLLESIQTEWKDFNASFPIVLRWMVQLRKFNMRAFKKYLLKHASATLDTREAFLELQAEYLVYLYREEHAHTDETHIRQYRTVIVTQLLDEDKEFLKIQKQVEAELSQQSALTDADRRRRLYEYLIAQRS